MTDPVIREQIIAWLDDVIERVEGLAEYERDPDSDPTSFPAGSLTDNGQEPSEEEAAVTRYAMDIDVEIFVEGVEGRAVSAELNELHARLVTAVMTPGEPPIGGLAEEIHEGGLRRFTAMLASKPRKGFRQKFTIHFNTRRGDPARQ